MFLTHRRLSALAVLSLLLALLPLTQTQGRVAQAQHEVGAPFRDYYNQHQGIRILGYPLTDVLDVDSWTAQYFEKGRIEDHRRQVVDANWAFMYGRLTDELFTRRPQGTVNSTSITYADLQRSADPRYRHPAPSGLISGVMPLTDGMFVPYDSQLHAAPGYLIPMRFWTYINRRDLFPGGWLHDIGLPMTDSFTVETIKNGERRVITMQAFERSVLTDDPLNPAGWQVERGNIGADAVPALPPGPVPPPSGAIEVPAYNTRVTLPLHIRARVGQPNERVQAVLRWQDGTTLSDTFGVLRDPSGNGLLIASLDWRDVLRTPLVPTQAATLELRNQQGSLLAQQRITVLSANDPATETVQMYWVVGDRVQAQPRQIPSTKAIGTAVVEALLWGPTTNQTTFKTALPLPADVLAYPRREASWGDHVSLRSMTIDRGIATVDLSRELRAYGCGTERVRLMREQITRTLQQFPGVREVRIAVDGRIDEIFQPPSSVIELPGPGACVTEPLHLLARTGTPGEQVQATLRWQDGATISR
ncbi:MAG TPA: GerMN domain-containing protein, partial [Herpetosiphonaceae bacterium]